MRPVAVAGAFAALTWAAAYAEAPADYSKETNQYHIVQGNLRADEIELRNAIRVAPQDPILRARLAEVYLQLRDAPSAEREARATRELKGDEADYLPVLVDALLRQGKFADLMDLVQPSDRNPALESKVRTALGTVAAGLGRSSQGRDPAGRGGQTRSERCEAENAARAAVERNENLRG